MDFELTDDQLELQRVVHDVVARECPPSLVRAVLAGGDDDVALWKTFVGLDWPSLRVPESTGGMGFGAVELVLALEELGWVADPTPFLATTSQYVPVLRACEGADPMLAAVCAGGTGAVAWAGVDATPRGDRWVLRGTARAVLDGDRADEIAAVTTAGVFVVPSESVRATRTPAFDGSLHIADVGFDDVEASADRAFPGADVLAARAEALAGLSAVMVGASQRILDLVVEHVRQRHQFGVPIGSFQAVKHMAVDVFVAIQRARALTQFAALAIDEADPRRTTAASMAKAAAGDCQRIAAGHGIQLFGGLGYTWENDLQLFVRRAKAGELLLGGAAEHRARVAREVLAR
jgi:alkylation response protein AidB-like acyl-CoA dehydrogenase